MLPFLVIAAIAAEIAAAVHVCNREPGKLPPKRKERQRKDKLESQED